MTKRQVRFLFVLLGALLLFSVFSVGKWGPWRSGVGSQEKKPADGVDMVSQSTVGERPSRGSWLRGTTDERFQ